MINHNDYNIIITSRTNIQTNNMIFIIKHMVNTLP